MTKYASSSILAKAVMALSEGPDLGEHGEATDKSGQFWGDAGAGCLFVAMDTGRLLFSYRSAQVNEPHTWGVWGGAIDEGEDPAEAAVREAREEMGYQGSIRLEKVFEFQKDGFKFTTFLAFVPKEFTPKLDWETEDFTWIDTSFTAWPQPLHFGLRAAEGAIISRLRSFYRDRKKVSSRGISNTTKLRNPIGGEPSEYTIDGYHATTIDNLTSILEKGLLREPSGKSNLHQITPGEGNLIGQGVYLHQALPPELNTFADDSMDFGEPVGVVIHCKITVPAESVVVDPYLGYSPDETPSAISSKDDVVIGGDISPNSFVELIIPDNPVYREWYNSARLRGQDVRFVKSASLDTGRCDSFFTSFM